MDEIVNTNVANKFEAKQPATKTKASFPNNVLFLREILLRQWA
jgi:hypothetical protein